MIVHAFRCEACQKEHHFRPDSLRTDYSHVPSDWLTLTEGNPQVRESLHFCSHACLIHYLNSRTYPALPVLHPPAQTPQSKMRRFLLIDGETADEFEAIQFSSGHVSVDFDAKHFPMHFSSWDQLKEMNSGSGVTWIDQEVSE